MKFSLLKGFLFSLLTSGMLFSGCQSQKPAFNNSSAPNPATVASPAKNNSTSPGVAPAPASEQPAKTLGEPAPKLVYDSTKISFKIKQKTEVETYKDSDDDDEEISISKSESTEKYRSHEAEEKREKWISGGFLASGTILLLVSLALVIFGSGPAGLLAIIGGVLFLTGFILTLVELLGD